MRFLPAGPSIPDELLEERDNGNVVFLCGAGVSYPARMPDFLGLARYVVKELGTPENAPSRTNAIHVGRLENPRGSTSLTR